MLIIILGTNSICAALASALQAEGHDICLVSEQQQALEHLQQFLDCQTVVGCPSHPHVLKSANANQADMLIAATENDEMNMIACQVAYSLFKIERKIAFISNAHYWARHELFGSQNLPIDNIISLDNIVAQQLSELITFSTGFLYDSFAESSLSIGITTVNQLDFHKYIQDDFKLLTAFRKGEILDLDVDTITTSDQILFLCQEQKIDEYVKLIYGPTSTGNKIVIGASNGVIDAFCKSHQSNLKVISPKLADCQYLAQKHSNATILNGHITENELLSSVNMEKIEFFCAITEDDEDNIMAALQAKELGAKQTIAMINKLYYKDMISSSTIDFILNPNAKVLEQVIAHIRHPWIRKINQIPGTEYQIIELENPRELTWDELETYNILACTKANNTIERTENIEINSTILLLLKNNELKQLKI